MAGFTWVHWPQQLGVGRANAVGLFMGRERKLGNGKDRRHFSETVATTKFHKVFGSFFVAILLFVCASLIGNEWSKVVGNR